MPDILCPDITLVLFDFGGVLAEEGFLHGLTDIARAQGLESQVFIPQAVDLIFAGYATGRQTEAQFWQALRQAAGFKADDDQLRQTVLDRFVLRPWMFDIVDRLAAQGLTVSILSDQTNWLDELNQLHGFFSRFHHVFNSFHTGLSKRSPESFHHVLQQLNAMPAETLFIDDAARNVALARQLGFHAIHYEYEEPETGFAADLEKFCPGLAAD